MPMLVKVAEGLYALHYDTRMLPGVVMPCRTLVFDLDGELLLVSPGPLDEAWAAELDALGIVRWIASPNLFHHLHLQAASERWPEAALLGPAGLAEKRKNLTFTGRIEDAQLPDGLEVLPLRGASGAGEIVFHHPASRTLVVCDLVFNVTEPKGLMTPVVMTLMGTRGRVAASRLLHTLVTDKAEVRASLAELLAIDFDRLVMAHGAIVETGGREALKAALVERFGDVG